jgi:uncharacterized glyoxalase superfamily protein PhnB
MTADPMDALRLPVVPVSPRAAFAADLRARVAGWLGGDDDPLIAAEPGAATAGTEEPALTPYLSVRGGAAAIRWYQDVLGAELLGDPIVEDNGRVGHAELRIGDGRIALADEYPELDILSPLSRGGPSVQLRVAVADCDATFARAVAAGASVRREPADEFYGARSAGFRDPFGHEWSIQQPLETVTQEQMAERLAGSEYRFAPIDELTGDLPVVDLGDRAAPAHDQRRAADRVGDLGYFTIDVPDPDATAEFFTALFGWTVEQGNLEEGRHIASIAPPGGIHGGRPVGFTAYFRVDDLEAAASRVRELGGEVVSITDYPSGGNASCRDPQGVPFELWKPAPGY